ncbi:ferrous iron transport protein B [bacterium]|nr:ferrous iron transport protein B [bacterium]
MPAVETPVKTGLRKVALIGNPNTGKSTLFNALTGMQARIGNFPGVTVEKKVGRIQFDNRTVELIDLPGTYSLSPRTLDEMVSVDVLLGRQRDVGDVDAVVCIVDASNLERNLYLVSQVLDLGLPTILVLNMWDVAQARHVSIDVEGLRQKLNLPVIVCEAHRRMGINEIRSAIVHCDTLVAPLRPKPFPAEFYQECSNLTARLRGLGEKHNAFYLIERLLLDVGGQVETTLVEKHGETISGTLADIRGRLKESGFRIPLAEAKSRYAWAREVLTGLVSVPERRVRTRSDRIDGVLTHRFAGLGVFALLMFIVFQAIFTWAAPVMDLIETGQSMVADLVASRIPPGPLRSLINDGVVAGVGGVLVFVPQIALLFFFIAILEDCGYMARAAFVMDKLMKRIGLSGKSFVPLMSSFACAIPGVMATRVIENRRDRMVTILIAPLMSCSARLPVYVLMTAAFVPPVVYSVPFLTAATADWETPLGISLKGIVLFAMVSLGAAISIPVAWLLKKTFFKGETPPFVMELPSYKWPSVRIVAARVYDRVRAFVVRAGTLIFATTVLIWAASYFPGDHSRQHELEASIEPLQASVDLAQERLDRLQDDEVTATDSPDEEPGNRVAEAEAFLAESKARLGLVADELNRTNGELLAGSVLGRAGHFIEPAVRPLGWDWKIGVGVIASFPAREVIVATLGTIYSLGSDVTEDDEGLISQLTSHYRENGIVLAFSVMVFFALCAQCAATLMVIRRETNSWRWPVFTFAYMTALAYLGALLTYQLGMVLLT